MSSTPRVLAFAGSARRDSLNRKLLAVAVRGVAEAGVPCTVMDLRDHSLPVYDGDLEEAEGLPKAAVALRHLFAEHDALLIASPEHNGSHSALLKNTIDWVSRAPGAKADLSGFAGRIAALVAASPGPLGGLRGLVATRMLLTHLGVTVLASQFTLRDAANAFDGAGELVDSRQSARAVAVGRELGEAVRRLRGS